MSDTLTECSKEVVCRVPTRLRGITLEIWSDHYAYGATRYYRLRVVPSGDIVIDTAFASPHCDREPWESLGYTVGIALPEFT